jgi:hypothetical protein
MDYGNTIEAADVCIKAGMYPFSFRNSKISIYWYVQRIYLSLFGVFVFLCRCIEP